MNAYVFVSVPVDESEVIRELTEGLRRGFGSVRVRVSINDSAWATSIFPESATGRFLLPVKKAIRQAEGIEVGDTVAVTIELVL
ncbi:DUF1905 domain-containing protein [Cryobacterium arcticum]|uniref:DUF1905 domain-containing protein n=2 Tax=Cryobacterium arcticum TaxID=670052 RepID=A0A317ZNK3_9MICO|nr:DUF1905 domain-containing protein [Cryobacterium arcticum]